MRNPPENGILVKVSREGILFRPGGDAVPPPSGHSVPPRGANSSIFPADYPQFPFRADPPLKLFWQIFYTGLLLPLAVAAAYLGGMFHPKVRASLRGRRGVFRRLKSALAGLEPGRPLLWFHVVSAGEYLQAAPVITRLTAHGFQVVLTVSSVTGHQWAAKRAGQPGQAAVVEFLPLDFPWNMRRMVRLLRPRVVVYTKFDLWPNMVWAVRRAGIPQVLISGTLQPASLRVNNRVGRSLFATLYRDLDAILAVTGEDHQRFALTAPDHPRLLVAGDTRFDSVLDRKQGVVPPPLPPAFTRGPVFIAGSIWPADEARLFPALRHVLARHPDVNAVIVPHEITPSHLKEVETAFEGMTVLRFSRLDDPPIPLGGASSPPSPTPRIILVDSVGHLSALYYYGSIAYVGGGFASGVHNTMEPAAFGVPPLFGPRYHNAPEAVEMAALGLGVPVRDGAELETALFSLADDAAGTKAMGHRAAQFIKAKAGASDRCFQLIKELAK